jgi:hypothetical protein
MPHGSYQMKYKETYTSESDSHLMRRLYGKRLDNPKWIAQWRKLFPDAASRFMPVTFQSRELRAVAAQGNEAMRMQHDGEESMT